MTAPCRPSRQLCELVRSRKVRPAGSPAGFTFFKKIFSLPIFTIFGMIEINRSIKERRSVPLNQTAPTKQTELVKRAQTGDPEAQGQL